MLFCEESWVQAKNLRKFLIKTNENLVFRNYIEILKTAKDTKDMITVIKLTLMFLKSIRKTNIGLSFNPFRSEKFYSGNFDDSAMDTSLMVKAMTRESCLYFKQGKSSHQNKDI